MRMAVFFLFSMSFLLATSRSGPGPAAVCFSWILFRSAGMAMVFE